MPVAKTYQNMKIEGEPFKENSRMYVNVHASKGIKKVRWYSDAEYWRMYPNEVVVNDIMDFNARHAFGFGELGWIILYKADSGLLADFADAHHEAFRYNCTFGFYTPSRIPMPDLPAGISPVRLAWNDVMDHDDRMKSHEEVQKIVNKLLYGETTSKYQGAINDWLTKEVIVKSKKTNETHYGTKHTYNLRDAEGNTYVWETGAKDYACDTSVSLKMKVKDHKEINGEQVTLVWYCKEC